MNSDKKEKTKLIIVVVSIFAVVAGIFCAAVLNIVEEVTKRSGIDDGIAGRSEEISDEERRKAESYNEEISMELSDDSANSATESIDSVIGDVGDNMASVNGVIFNSAGAVNAEFQGNNNYKFFTDPKGEVGMIFVNGEVYLIDSGLNTTLIDSDCADAVMNYTGKYIYIASSEESKLGKGLCVYDVDANEYKFLEECDISESFCISVSPDGNVALVSRGDGVFIIGLDGTSEKIYEPGKEAFHAVAVSNDKKVAFFYPARQEGFLCWRGGETVQFSDTKIYGGIAVNSDCKKILYKVPSEELKYFDSGTMNEAKIVVQSDSVSAYIKGREFVFAEPDVSYYADVDSFEGTYITSNKGSFWVNANMDAVCNDEYRTTVCSNQGDKVYDYDDEGKIIYSITYKNGATHKEEIYHDYRFILDFTVSDDDRLLWIALENKIILCKDGKEFKDALTISEDSLSVNCLKTDPLTGKVFCLTNKGNIYMFDENGNPTEVCTVKNPYDFNVVCSQGKYIIACEDIGRGYYYLIVHGRIIREH